MEWRQAYSTGGKKWNLLLKAFRKAPLPLKKGGREGFWGMGFQKAKQSNQDSTRIERYQRVILALPEDKPFRKTDIFEAIKEELPIYIGRVINELSQDGFLRKSESGKKYSWTNKKNIFNIATWVKHRVLSPTVTRSPSLDRPRERLLRLGPSELKTSELLAVLIRSGLQGESAVQAGEKLASVFGNDLQKISSQGMGELKQISRAIGKTAYCQIMAALELGKRTGKQLLDDPKIPYKISNSSDALDYCRIQFARLAQEAKQEEFHIVLLDGKQRVMKTEKITVGLLNESLAHPREVFKPALRESAAAIILVHNHPDKDPMPSQDDLNVTKELQDAAGILGLRILDHIILSKEKCLSMVEEGYL